MPLTPFALLLLAFGPELARGHGNLVYPYSWQDQHKIGLKSRQQCSPGCAIPPKPTDDFPDSPFCTCMWFNNYTKIPEGSEINMDDNLRTYHDVMITVDTKWGPQEVPWDWTAEFPWRRPGSAPIDSPCGVGGGNPEGCVEGDGPACGNGGYAFGPAAEEYYREGSFPNPPVTEWKIGGVEEAAWGITANHGGGYSYRLCPADSDLTEECFRAGHLDFVGDQSWVQHGDDFDARVAIDAVRTSANTEPEGSTWTKNPIPACDLMDGGFYHNDPRCEELGTQFPAPAPGLAGFGLAAVGPSDLFDFTIFDKIQVPDDLEPGDYILSFRWDCEQTSQVWNTCANVKLVA